MTQDKQEYEDAAEILRHDLTDAQKHVSQLKSIIASRDNGDIDRLSQQCSHLAAKVRDFAVYKLMFCDEMSCFFY